MVQKADDKYDHPFLRVAGSRGFWAFYLSCVRNLVTPNVAFHHLYSIPPPPPFSPNVDFDRIDVAGKGPTSQRNGLLPGEGFVHEGPVPASILLEQLHTANEVPYSDTLLQKLTQGGLNLFDEADLQANNPEEAIKALIALI